MEQLWNAMVSIVICTLSTKGLCVAQSFEPGSMEYTIFPTFPCMNLGKIASKIKRKSKELSGKTLRDVILTNCSEFNHGYFFMILQCAILAYYPSVALSIIYQYYDLEMQQDEEQQDVFQEYQYNQSCIKRERQSLFIKQQNQSLAQQQQIAQHPFMQFIQLLQRLIDQIIQSSQFEPHQLDYYQMQQIQQQQQQYHPFAMQQQYQSKQVIKTTTKSTQNNENGRVRVKLIVRLIGEERHNKGEQEDNIKIIWQHFIITF